MARSSSKSAKKSKPAKKSQKSGQTEFIVNLWATDLNDVEIGIMPATKARAKSRQFTKDMDVIGEIKENGERTGIVAYREGLWEDNDGMDKRLVIKLFSASMNWKGTMDLLIGRSLQLTHGAGNLPVTAYSVNLSGHDQIIQLERSAYKWPMFPERFSFFILRDGKPFFYRLRKLVMAMGSDYGLYDHNNKRIGTIDGKVFTIGGKWKCRVDEEHADELLKATLQLFCTMQRFNDEARWHISDLVSDMHDGDVLPAIEHHEADLYMNPRRVR